MVNVVRQLCTLNLHELFNIGTVLKRVCYVENVLL